MRSTAAILAFVLTLNVIFFFAQTAVNEMNPGENQFFNYEGSDLQSYDAGGYTLENNPESVLPTTETSISATTGNVFTDAWSASKNWLTSIPGVKFMVAIFNTVPNILQSMGLPVEFSFAIGYLWVAFSAFVLIMFIRGVIIW